MASVTMTAPVNDDTVNNGMTEGQINALFDNMRAAFRKSCRKIPSEVAQKGLGVDNLGMRMFVAFRNIAETSANYTVRTAQVDRSRSPQKAIHDIMGCAASIDYKVVNTMPKRKAETVELVYFRLDLESSDAKITPSTLAEEYEKRGLVPDPLAQIDHNTSDSAFAAEMPNISQWKDEYGNYFFVMFTQRGGHHRLMIRRSDCSYDSCFWFAGVRKES